MSATLLKTNKWYNENAIDTDFIKLHEHLESYGPRHVPVSHALILSLFRNKCEANGLMLFNERGALSKNGDRYMYVADIIPEVTSSNTDYNMSIGFRSFNDESAVFQMSCGVNVLICSNGLQTACVAPSRRKHTKTIHDLLDAKIENGLERFKKDSTTTEENIRLLKATPYSDELLGKLIVALGRTKKIGNTNIMKILDEVDNPSYNNKADSTAWRIMNACTTVTTHRMANPLLSLDTSKIMMDELMKLIKPDYVPMGNIVDEAA